MALHWNVTDIANNEAVTTAPKIRADDPDKWHPVTEALVWYSMICGFSRISASNLDEVWRRIRIWEGINGPLLGNDEGDIRLTKADVERHVGLRTNASTMTKVEFKSKVMRHLDEKIGPSDNVLPAHVVIEDRIDRARAELEE